MIKFFIQTGQRISGLFRDGILGRFIRGYLCNLGFANYYQCHIHGPKESLHWNGSRTINAIFNTRSGHIYIGDNVVISHNCMFLTGRHLFDKGKLKIPRSEQVPASGYDIKIGNGCWIASGAIILGGVTLGEDCLVCAGAVVTKSFPSGSIIAGVPASLTGKVTELAA